MVNSETVQFHRNRLSRLVHDARITYPYVSLYVEYFQDARIIISLYVLKMHFLWVKKIPYSRGMITRNEKKPMLYDKQTNASF